MLKKLNQWMDVLSDFFAARKGLLPMLGLLLVLINFVLQFFPLGWINETDILLHMGVIVAILGFLLAWAL